MALESTIRELSDGLKSVRVTDRKKNAESLKDFLTRNALPSLLTTNTLHKRGYSWSDLFDDVNEYIFKETEKYETSKTFESVIKPLCTSLLHLVVAGSNKGHAYVSCDKITEACLFILKDNRLKRAIGDAYLNLLYKHVLPCEYYLGFITLSTWEDLLDVCLSSCISNYSKLDDYTKLRLILLIMKNATSYCQFVIPLRDALAKWKRCFYKVVVDKKAQEVVVEIMILLLETLSVECRLTLCHFMETTLSQILKCYDQNLDYKKKSSLFHLLHLTVTLHHPQGRSRNRECSVADDWTTWNRQLHNILEVICIEVAYLQRIRKLTDDVLQNTSHFYQLSAAVYFQIFSMTESAENEAENSSKRFKISFNKNKTFTDLIDELRRNHLPWLGIIHIFVENNHSGISIDDYISLSKVIEGLVTNNGINFDVFEEITCLVIKNLKSRAECRIEECDIVIFSLWNTLVRNSTTQNVSHKAIHNIMQYLLTLDLLKHQQAQSLFKFYIDKGMPITCESVATLCILFHKFFSKYSYDDVRNSCIAWLIQGDVSTVNIESTKNVLIRLLAKENLPLISKKELEENNLRSVVFNNEKGILFSEFEIEVKSPNVNEGSVCNPLELNAEVEKVIHEYLLETLLSSINKLESKSLELPVFMKTIHLVMTFVNIMIKSTKYTENEVKEEKIFQTLKTALLFMYSSMDLYLNKDGHIANKIKLINVLKDIFLETIEDFLSFEVRSLVHKDFFKTLNKIIIDNEADDDDVVYTVDEKEVNSTTLKHACVLLLAAYCRKNVNFKEELLNLILDPKLYVFSKDANCIFQCLDLLNDGSEDPPSELMFTLLQYMCKDLYRNPKSSYGILTHLKNMLDKIWSSEGTMKLNCVIMIRSYIQRCEKMHYPPIVAALIYECVAKIVTLNQKHSFSTDDVFGNALLRKVKGNVHRLRLYCCYLMKNLDISEEDSENFLKDILEIFVINVSDNQEYVIKDELANRTLTILHCYLSIVQTKRTLFQKLITNIFQIQKEKKLNEYLVKKVLKKFATIVGLDDFETYVNKNIVSILYSWFLGRNSIEDLPVHLMGYVSLESFLKSHKKWVVSADMLWRKDGDLRNCDYANQMMGATEQSVQNLTEDCFCQIMALCLPYLVTEKYRLSYLGSETYSAFKKSMASAKKMFQLAGEILENDKWTNLFVENVGNLVLLNATYLCDRDDARQMFEIYIPEQTRTYCYPKNVFISILNYFGDLNDGSIIEYLCENQPLAIFQVLFVLWRTVLEEKVLELKVLAVHAFITFIEVIPLDQPSDAFVCNFACKSFTHSIEICSDRTELAVLTKGVKIVLERFMPDKVDLMRKSVIHLLTTLVIKKEEGFERECNVLFGYLMDMKHYLKDSVDVVDLVSSLSQGAADNVNCSTLALFKDKLKTHETGFNCPSPETLSNLRQLLRNNKHYLKLLYETMSPKGFSEDCGSSIIHQIVHLLSNVLKSNRDEKIIIEASNCLSEIGTYDLRTLVTVPPINTQKIVEVHPKQYFTCVVVKTLSEAMFDDPGVTKCVVETLNDVLKYKEGVDALGLEQVDKEILKSLTSSNGNNSFEVKISGQNFSEYCVENFDGIFLKAMTHFWIPNDDENAKNWLKAVTTALLKLVVSGTNYFGLLLEVCGKRPNVCQKILPPLVGLILHCSSEKYTEALSRHMNMFFNYIWEQTFDERFETRDISQVNWRMNSVLDVGHKMVIQYMLDVVDFIRLQKSYYKARPERTIEAYNYLRLEYDKVAWAATVADQNLAAIYYGEMWTMSRNDGVPPSAPEATTNIPGGENIQQIFRQCYVSIGEMDAIDGCGTAHLTIDTEIRKHLINTGQYADALLLHDIAASCSSQLDPELQLGTVRSLHKSGMHHLAMQYIKSLPESDYLNDIKYECLSFLGDWSEIIDTKSLEEKAKLTNCNPESILKAYHYSCLKDCLNIQITPEHENKLISTLNKAKMVAAKLCQGLNMENCQSVYKVLSKLHLFTDIEDYFLLRSNTMSTKELLNKWEMDKLPKFNDFRHLECMISQRTLMLEHAAKSCSRLRDDVVALQIQYAKLGLSNNRVQMAQRLLAFVKKTKSSEEVALAESEISWAKGHKEIALSLLRNIVSQESQNVQLTASSMSGYLLLERQQKYIICENCLAITVHEKRPGDRRTAELRLRCPSVTRLYLPLLLRQFALWMAESKRDNARDIIDKYLLKSLKVLQKNDHLETRLKVYHDIAKFADTEYKQVVSYMNSSIFEKKGKVMESLRGTASSLRSTQHSLTRDQRKVLFTNERFKELDEVEIESTKAEKESFLNLAMRYYLLSLKQCEENNLSVFRVISLWLDNPSFTFDDSEQSFETLLHSIPSRKFITVLPQLAPRLTNEDTPFAENLRRIIRRCAIEHPHHTLPIIFSLKNSDKDKLIMNASGAIGGGTQHSRAQEPRVVAAIELVKHLAGSSREMAVIVSQMEKICDATISFANYKPTAKDSRQKIPSAEPIQKLNNLDAIPIPTVTIPINSDCKYKYFPTLLSFDSYFELVGGINCPKKVSCLDSSGSKHILLIKGEDDMRQDAVMQQVFTIVNTLLDKNPVTSRNKLLIRTYKVVPMSKQSGVLEWCVGTIPLGVYLAGTGNANNGAHARYRPRDMSCHMARKLIHEDHKAGKNNRDKLATFTKILREFKPVFHYFFTEHYLDPVTWYERRLAYNKSVATSSMVGYILGLGDRHVQNILVDKRTAEVIHIDFGIAFDQGKTLHTPETVPFRLTQDMIAGFGSSGVEGIFRRCCEKTMQLLRDNSETLLTILEVLLCDPLYSWTVTTNQQNTANRNTTVHGACGSNSGLAERALLAVSSKLSGTEGGVAGGVAVPGQVARLLHSATDPVNLCKLFHGWQPYL